MKQPKYSYDPEADVLAVEFAKKPFDYAEEVGDFIVHFTQDGKPVYVEILNASKFLLQATKNLPKPTLREFVRQIHST